MTIRAAITLAAILMSSTSMAQHSREVYVLPYMLSGGVPPLRPTPLEPTELEKFEGRMATTRAKIQNKLDELDQSDIVADYKSDAITYVPAAIIGGVLMWSPPTTPLAIALITGITSGVLYGADKKGQAFIDDAEALRKATVDALISDYVGSDFRNEIDVIRALPVSEQAARLSQLISSAANLQAGRTDNEVGDYLGRMIDLLQSELNDANSKDAAKRAEQLLKRAGRKPALTPAALQARAGAAKRATGDLADALVSRLGPVTAAMADGVRGKTAAAENSLEVALRNVSGLTSTVKTLLPAFANLGVDPSVISAVTETVSKVESGMALVAGIASVYSGNPAGLVPAIQGLSGLLGSSRGQPDRLGAMLRALEGRLIRIEQKIDDLIRAQRATYEALIRFELDTKLTLSRLERDVRLARQELAASTGDLAFQGFRSCNALDDYLARSNQQNPVSIQSVGYRTYGQILAQQLSTNKSTIIAPCLAAVRSLFASRNSLTISNPLLRDDRALEGELYNSIKRRVTFVELVSGALRGSPIRDASNGAIRDFLFASLFEDDTKEIARLWVAAQRGNLQPNRQAEYIELDSLFNPSRINPARFSVVASTVLSVVPIYWFVDLDLSIINSGQSADPQVAKGKEILENLSRINISALMDHAIANEGAATPIVLSNIRRSVDNIRRLSLELKALPQLKKEEVYSNRHEFESARKKILDKSKEISNIRRSLFRVEAMIMTDERLARKIIEFEFYRALEQSMPIGDARNRKYPGMVAELLLNGKALEAGKRFYELSGTGSRRDLYWESLKGTVFERQEKSDEFRTIYDSGECKGTRDGEVADWIKVDPDREIIETYCARLRDIQAAEEQVKMSVLPSRYAYFGGFRVLPPSAGRMEGARDDTQSLRDSYILAQKLLALGKTTILADNAEIIMVDK